MPQVKVRQAGWQRLLQALPASKLGAAVFAKTLHLLDRPLLKMSGGRLSIGGLTNGLPTVLLTTTGAKSGQQRTVPTIGIPHGDDIVLIASNWGGDHHPAWFHNLRKHPRVTVGFDGHEGAYTAREVTDEGEYETLWEAARKVYVGYDKYRARVGTRRIPIVVLAPIAEGG